MPPDPLSAIFAALADPTRRAILERLARGSATVKDLAEPFPISGPAVTKHLHVLEHAGLIARGRDAQRRPCRLEAAPLKEILAWVERYRQYWEGTLDHLEEYIEAQVQPSSPTRRKQRARDTRSRRASRRATPRKKH